MTDDGLIIQSGHYADVLFEAHNGTSMGKGISLLVITPDDPTPKPRVYSGLSGYTGAEQVRVKRTISVAQPAVGVWKSGTYMSNAAWELGQVLPGQAGVDFADWYAPNYPSESGSYPADASVVSWTSRTDYIYETCISVNLRP